MERDLTIPEWVAIPCPECGERIQHVNANAVTEISWPLVMHDCGFKGPVQWVNPDSDYLLARAEKTRAEYQLRQRQLEEIRS